jgi:hypothetical protein
MGYVLLVVNLTRKIKKNISNMCISCLVDNNCLCIKTRTIVEIEREKCLSQIALWPKMYDLIAQERKWGKRGEKINRTGE